ncbi:MAG: flagellar basal body P-ring protein FlgI [Gemmataceae bacterium]|nr:flagellar basal body P-ring protein FlgI [Gemmataceae bacterium]
MHRLLIAAAVALGAALPASAQGVRIKDITEVAGARPNQLIGFGLVAGLDQTGSRSTFTQQVAVDMLQRQGVTTGIFSQLPSESVIRSTSIAAVIVIAEIGPFSRKGTKIDVLVSTMDDSRSLQGGTLLQTPLRGADGQVYAVAQGAVSIGGFSVTAQASGVQKNHLNAGRVPGGALVEKEAPGEVVFDGNKAQLLLKEADFNTSRLIAKTVNDRHPGVAVPLDPGSVLLCVPADFCKNPTQFLAEVGLLEVRPDVPARVVINERTGTVVAGENVSLSTTAVSHGNLYIGVATSTVISQPQPFSGGQTAVVPQATISAAEERRRMIVVPQSTTVAEVARALNALGVTPRDLIAIFQTLKTAGALHAELIIN